jgi:Rrf2 family iron-sulfur cluster assembly transcriptional regulator
MKLTTRSRYGTRLVLDMAQHYDEGLIQLSMIAKRQNIPLKYLEKIVTPLKRAKYVKSVRGAKGGHMLAKHPEEITVGEIVLLLEKGLILTRCTENPEVCDRSETCLTRSVWKEATEALHAKLKSITLMDLVMMERACHKEQGDQNVHRQGNGSF